MIRVDDIEQGTEEWKALRLGIPTASNFDKIITTDGKPSKQQDKYIDSLVAEWATGEADEANFKSYWVDRGIELEPDARRLFQFERDIPVEQTGMVYINEKKLVSCSPDGLIADSGLEIKCPKASTFVGYVNADALPDTYKQQVYGSMWVCGYDSWNFMAYHPKFKPFIITVEANPVYLRTLGVIVEGFIDRMLKARDKIKPYLEEL